MLSVDVQKVTLMCLGDNQTFIIDVDMRQTQERAQMYTDFYMLIKLTVPIFINGISQIITIQKQFMNKVKDLNTSDYILRGLCIEWPGQLDQARLEIVLKGKATLQFFNISQDIE